MRFLIIKENKVFNVSYFESQEEAERLNPDAACLENEDLTIKPGYLLEEGDFVPPVVIPQVPANVTPRQIRQAMSRIGLRATVEAAVAASDQDIKDWWEFSTTFERNRPQVLMMATALGKTAEDLDNLWLLASSL